MLGVNVWGCSELLKHLMNDDEHSREYFLLLPTLTLLDATVGAIINVCLTAHLTTSMEAAPDLKKSVVSSTAGTLLRIPFQMFWDKTTHIGCHTAAWGPSFLHVNVP